ncbi:MAG TPA: hypothetical protein VFX70_16100 [Mycobacteriales bacterium]|nr:hypothetical protein [Mycobacteriales bacterium]
MTFRTRSIVATVGLVAGLAAAAAIPTPAQATSTVPGSSVMARHAAFMQPIGVTAQNGTVSPATTSPSTSPSAEHIFTCHPGHADCGALPGCQSGFACAYVVVGELEWQFQFFNYGAYHLSNWVGTNALANHQTGGAAVRTYNVSGGQIHCYAPRTAAYSVDWNPVWRINLTSNGC